jgi:hypothetical protein
VGVQWEPATPRAGYPLQGYQVSASRLDRATDPVTRDVGAGTRAAEVTGLAPGTHYSLTVRGQCAAGLGLPTEPIVVLTDPAAAAPPIPFDEPTLDPSSTGACDGIDLLLPALRPGCAGDTNLRVLVSSGGEWRTAADGAVHRRLRLNGLDAYAAHRFRLVAVNAAGESAVGRPSAAMLTDGAHGGLLTAPEVIATSSASFRVSWAASPCRPQLVWEVVYAHRAGGQRASGDAHTWRTAAGGVAGGSVELHDLRCPRGCAFRVRPAALQGWDQWSEPSAEVHSPELPPIPVGGVRVELELSAPMADLVSSLGEPSGGAGSFRLGEGASLAGGANSWQGGGAAEGRAGSAGLAEAAAELSLAVAVALQASPIRFALVEARAAGRYAVMDILPAGFGESDTRRPEALAVELGRRKPGLRGEGVATDVTAVRLLLQDGSVTPLGSRPQEPLAARALKVTISICAAVGGVISLVVLARACSRAAAARRRSGGGRHKHTRAAPDRRRPKRLAKRLENAVESEEDLSDYE